MALEPIAIVGRGCVLPGALDPDQLWRNVLDGTLSLSPAPEGRWRLSRRWAMGSPADSADRTWSDAGGYVSDFASVFDASAYPLPGVDVAGLDRIVPWTLHAAGAALRESGQERLTPRAGLVMGNLSYPSTGLAQYAEHVWRGGRGDGPHPYNRFSSGLPAHLAARALGLGLGGLALDAACASSLYAIALACQRLRDRRADLMMAGGVNGADDLFLHVSFCSLGAMSRSGRSRPFQRGADGLVPAEGAAFVALMRLDDAVAAGAPIRGVVRAVGLSNDGRGKGLLVPSREGQRRAMEQAYSAAAVDPATVGLLECHATGTAVGDAVEAGSTAHVFATAHDLPIGSIKSNLGHTITAAGAAGLLKVLGALQAGVRPATLGIDEPLAELAGTPLRPLREPEDWPGPRRAAVSAFGFGGNNAHLIVDAWPGGAPATPAFPPASAVPASGADSAATLAPPVAIVAIGARVADGASARDLTRTLMAGRARPRRRATVRVSLDGLRFPPLDLHDTHAQQLLVLEAAREAAARTRLPRDRTMVLVGMGGDPEVARHIARWRVPEWLLTPQEAADPRRTAETRDAIHPAQSAASVVGTMPNLVANRINSQLDLAGPSFTVSAEEASGLAALEIGVRALRTDEADAVLVGAVDLADEPVHRAALAAIDRAVEPGDAAVVIILKRLDDARRDGDAVLALVPEDSGEPARLVVGDAGGSPGSFDPAALFGRAHAASGLLSVAVAALALHHRARLRVGRPATVALERAPVEAVTAPLGADPVRVRLREGDIAPFADPGLPLRLHVYSGPDRAGVLAALAAGRESGEGPARLALFAAHDADLADRTVHARQWLLGRAVRPAATAFQESPVAGEIAFVYSGGSMAYPGMGRDLMLAFPGQLDAVRQRCGDLRPAIGWALREAGSAATHPLDQIGGTSVLGQLHTRITTDLLGLHPDAALGYSSGESVSLAALGAWRDVSPLLTGARGAELFTRWVAGDLEVPRRAWRRQGVSASGWASYLVEATPARVRAALAGEPGVHLMVVNAPDSCVFGGAAESCLRVLDRLPDVPTLPIGYQIAAHVPETEEVRDAWWRLHHLPTSPVPGVRFYTCSSGRWYHPTADAAADAVTAQGLGSIDFAGTVERAWADGVRIFVEHGPRNQCTGWITRTLGSRPHLAVALDAPGGHAVRQLLQVTAELTASGVRVDAAALTRHLAVPSEPAPARLLELPAHPPEIRLPAHPPEIRLPASGPDEAACIMAPAPDLGMVPGDESPAPGARPPAATPDSGVPRPSARMPVAAHHSPLAAVMTAHHARLAESHRQYLATQARSHAGYLLSRQAAARSLQAAARIAATATAPGPGTARTPSGPAFGRAELERLATGPVSEIFGPMFAPQDRYARQTRMPAPPMLLADRVTGIDAEPGSMGTGTIWTETDVRLDSWYLDPAGRMPAGIMVEAGQADLLLISWLGVDLHNHGERVYRLLGCELTYHGSPPGPGDTVRYEIHIDGHGGHGGVRLFFFRYDAYVGDELRLSMRAGQAGFFTTDELAGTGGVAGGPGPAPPGSGDGVRSFGPEQVRAFAEGRPADCFGPGWELSRSHIRSPHPAGGRLALLHRVPAFHPAGGPEGRGYLRAETPVSPGDWFFTGHFPNDPCMPGTLMFEGCLQALAFYLAASGLTVDRDGWRFEPVTGTPFPMICRGQVTPESRLLTYEVFVSELSAAPEPTLVADVLCTVDGVRAFLVRGLGVRLVPDWPLSHWRQLGPPAVQATGTPVPHHRLAGLAGHRDATPVAEVDGFRYDYPAMLACAWGRPSEAFGPAYTRFDGTRRLARLPGPPFHFMSRVVGVEGRPWVMEAGAAVEVEYDVPDRVWYFEQNDFPGAMPFSVLLEVVLQASGWLASYVGSALTSDGDLLFRNLDGTGTVHREVRPGMGVLRTRTSLREVSRSGEMIIQSFGVECACAGVPVFSLTTVFGFFPPSAFDNQVGLPPAADEVARFAGACDFGVDLTARPRRYFGGPLHLPRPMLMMLDRVTGYWPDAGRAGLGRLRAEKDVDPGEWFFQAHFFQDPVQPGSLGVQAMCQLLQFYAIERGLGDGFPRPRFQQVLPGHAVSWKYRGQVTPRHRTIVVEVEIHEVAAEGRGVRVTGDGWLWADGIRIYHLRGLTVGIVGQEES
jgi:acyl transferase domain-containing protein/3-hydroxymyristoyl/3-hydroxydecanoyl-(acyl carrier protein) dehydratase